MYTPKPQWLKDRENAAFSGPKKPWGGYRPGSGRKRSKPVENLINIKLNSIQKMMLQEMGDGDLDIGVQVLIDKHL